MATDKETSCRLFKTYGITLEEYEEMLAEQNGVCAICWSEPKSRRLHTDHDHKWKYVKITTEKIAGRWFAQTDYSGGIQVGAMKKNDAIKRVRAWMKKASVRGLLCPNCNRGLRTFRDNPEFLASAAQYLRRFRNV